MIRQCIIKRNASGKVEKIYNPIAIDRSNYVTQVLVEHLRYNLNQPVFVDKVQMQDKLKELGYDSVEAMILGEQGTMQLSGLTPLKAIELENQAKSKSEIRTLTGWEKGADGLWKYEIPDSNISFREVEIDENKNFSDTYLLRDVMSYPELYKAYPSLETEVGVVFYNIPQSMINDVDMFFSDEDNSIYINLNKLKPNDRQGNKIRITDKSTLSNFLHEGQHIIQKIEGFGKGGAQSWIRTGIERVFQDIRSGNLQTFGQNGTRRLIKKALTQLLGDENRVVEAAQTNEPLLAHGFASIIYKRLAGEVEARNVERRLDFTEEERRTTLLEASEDIPRDQQIQFLQTPQGEVYGFTVDNQIYLDPELLNSNTLFHEYDHINHSILQKAAQNGDSRAQAILQKRKEIASPIVERVKAHLNSVFGKSQPSEKVVEFSMTMPDGRNVTVRRLPEQLDVVNGFYSTIEKALLELQQEKGTAAQFLAQIKKAKGVKQDELTFTGIEQYLTDQGNNKITKQDILKYMKENRIEIVEVVLDNQDYRTLPEYKDADEKALKAAEKIQEAQKKYWESNSDEDYDALQSTKEELEKWSEIKRNIEKRKEKEGVTKFSQYQLEGEKENYKEVLVTLPRKLKSKGRIIYSVYDKNDGSLIGKYLERFAADVVAKRENGRVSESKWEEIGYEDTSFKSTHFDEPNILVHLRMNTRTDADGNKVLFLEEIQSDWGQKGKKEGFKSDSTKKIDEIAKKLENDIAKAPSNLRMIDKIKWAEENISGHSELRKEFTLLKEKGETETDRYKTPTAPFVTSTPSWVKLGIKTALKEAVNQGATKIAWTTGEQQNERYDLSKSVDSIQYAKVGDDKYLVSVTDKNNNEILYNTSMPIREIEATLGKDIAEKIQKFEDKEQPSIQRSVSDLKSLPTIKGEGLKVGGSGMKGFYDNIVPSVAKAVVKELTGQEGVVGETKLGGKIGSIERVQALALVNEGKRVFTELRGEEYPLNTVSDVMEATNYYVKDSDSQTQSTQQSIEITPELKASVQQGIPQFQAEKTNPISQLTDIQIQNETENIINGKSIFKRFSQREHRGFIAGGKHNVQGTLLTNRVRETSTDDSTEWQAQAEKVLEQYAKENNIWIDLNSFGEPQAVGAEAYVWFNEGKNTVTKAIGYAVQNGLDLLFDKITIHNTLFPTTKMEVVGYAKDNSGNFNIVIEQPFIKGEQSTSPEVREYVRNIGLSESSDYSLEDIEYTSNDYMLTDLHLGNVLRTPDGNLAVIDGLFYLNTAESGYGGNRVLDNSIESTSVIQSQVEQSTALRDVESMSKDEKLNSFLNALNNKKGLQVNPVNSREFIYGDNLVSLEINRFDKQDRNEITLQDIISLDKGKGYAKTAMSDIVAVADSLNYKITLNAKPFGNVGDRLEIRELVDFYKKFGFKVDLSVFGGEFKSDEEYIQYVEENPSESVEMFRDSKSEPNIINVTEVTMKKAKGDRGEFDGEYDVLDKNGNIIGSLYFNTDRTWRDPNYQPKTTYDVYGDLLGYNKKEAVEEIVNRHNKNVKQNIPDVSFQTQPSISQIDSTESNYRNFMARDNDPTANPLDEYELSFFNTAVKFKHSLKSKELVERAIDDISFSMTEVWNETGANEKTLEEQFNLPVLEYKNFSNFIGDNKLYTKKEEINSQKEKGFTLTIIDKRMEGVESLIGYVQVINGRLTSILARKGYGEHLFKLASMESQEGIMPDMTGNSYRIEKIWEKYIQAQQTQPSPEATNTLGIESSVYAQRQNETDAEWTDRLEGEVMARLMGEEGQKIASQLEKDLDIRKDTILGKLKEWLKEFVAWLKSNFTTFKDFSDKQILEMSMKDFLRTSVGDLITYGSYRADTLTDAQTYFKREADRLPLTLSVFQRPEFVQMQGKEVKPISVLQALNQTGIKQIEKQLITDIINSQYKSSQKVSYDELEATVRANIMPLERLFTYSYSDLGMELLEGYYGEANTIIFNAPIDHGITGHFPSDFKSSNRKNIKYVPKQLNDNTWVAVEESYEQQDTNENNIYQFVGTVGTREVVENWTVKYNLQQGDIYNGKEYLVYQDAFDQKDNILPVAGFNTEQEAKNFIEENKDRYTYNLDYVDRNYLQDNWRLEDTNKGMFGHIRVWKNGNIFYVAELQSDYYQNYNARKSILGVREDYKEATNEREYRTDRLNEKRDGIIIKFKNLGYRFVSDREEGKTKTEVYIPVNKYGLSLGDRTGVKVVEKDGYFRIDNNGVLYGNYYKSRDSIERDLERYANEERFWFDTFKPLSKEDIPTALQVDYDFLTKEYYKEQSSIEKEFNEKVEKIIKNLSPQEKQFIASQKEFEKRMVREAIKEAALSGAEKLRFPTPHTLSVIEGYLDASKFVGSQRGDVIEYLGIDYVVVDIEGTDAVIVPLKNMEKVSIREFDQKKRTGEIPRYDDLYDYYLGEGGIELYYSGNAYAVEDRNGEYFYYVLDKKPEGIERIAIEDPKEKRNQDFSIEGSLTPTQQTVANKYLEIGEILKKERGEDNFEIVTDENGFDWYQTKLSPEEVNKPVVAFQVLSQFRDNTRFKFADLIYPDVVFKDITTPKEAKVAVEFYKKIVNVFNKKFGRNLKLDIKNPTSSNFTIDVEYETGLRPKYFAYPTATMGEHEVVDSINKDVPLTSLRHELLHEMLVKHITDKFERINQLDQSADAATIEEVQRNRAYNYTLEDVFFERVVENIERLPDNKDTFPIEIFAVDVVNRLVQELGSSNNSKDVVMSKLTELLEDSNPWLTETLINIFNTTEINFNDLNQSVDLIGKKFKNRFDLAKNIFDNELQRSIFEFTEIFNEEYSGVLTRLGKVDKRAEMVRTEIPAGNRLFSEPLLEVTEIAKEYHAKSGIPYVEPVKITQQMFSVERAQQIAKLYDEAKNSPNNPEVKRAYEAMVEETIQQYELILKYGYSVEINNSEPYTSSSDMIEDLRNNKRMKIFSTESGFGDTGITETQRQENPLLKDSGFKDVNGVPLLVNDVFRMVHDLFGHAKLGNSFGYLGEENAWNVHSNMYSPLARRAMTSETRGQNSYVNFSGVNDEAFKLRDQARQLRKEGREREAAELSERVYEMMKFADQKITLLPEWVADNSIYDQQVEQVKPQLTPPVSAESELFNNILANPHIQDEEQAKDILINVYSSKFIEKFGEWENGQLQETPFTYEGGEPKIFYRAANGYTSTNFEDVLSNVQDESIEMGFISTEEYEEVDSMEKFDAADSEFVIFKDKVKLNNADAFYSVATIPTDSNPNSYNGFINQMIQLSLLSPERIRDIDGNLRLAGKGANLGMRVYNASLVEDAAIIQFGGANVKLDKKQGTLEITPKNPDVIEKDGKEYSKDALAEQLKKGEVEEVRKVVEFVGEFAYNHYRQKRESVFEEKPVIPVTEAEENNIRQQLLNLLKSLGIDVTTISDYIKNYSLRNGVDLSVNAIADLSNRVVAFSQGQIPIEQLTEEVAHIIIEAYANQVEVEMVLAEVENSPEWALYSEDYYERFSKVYSNEQLQRAVRREILGKILAREMSNRFAENNQTSPTVRNTIFTLLQKFFDKIRNLFTRGKKSQLDILVKKAADIAVRKDAVEHLSKDNLFSSRMLFYSATTSGTNKKAIDSLVKMEKIKNAVKTNLAVLKTIKDPDAARVKMELEKLLDDSLTSEISQAAKIAVDVHDRQVASLRKKLDEFRKTTTQGAKVFFNSEDQAVFRYLSETALPILNELKLAVEIKDPSTAKKLSAIVNEVNNMKSIVGLVQDNYTDTIVDRVLNDYKLDDTHRDEIKKAFEKEQKDVSWLASNFFQLEHSSNPFLNLLGRLINQVYFAARQSSIKDIKGFLELASKGKWKISDYQKLLQKNRDGSYSQYLESEIDYIAYNEAKKDFTKKWLQDNLTDDQKNTEGFNIDKPDLNILTKEQLPEYEDALRIWKIENEERMMKDEYYTQVESDFARARVSAENRVFLASIQSAVAKIKAKYRRQSDGKIDYSQMSESDLDELARYSLYRKERKSEYDASTGRLKEGKELELAQELQRLDEIRSARATQRGTSKEFFRELRQVEATAGKQKAFSFLVANGGLVFNDLFWEKVGEGENTIDRASSLIDDLAARNEDVTNLQELLNTYIVESERRKQIIRQYQSPSNPAEINTDNMSDTVKENILESSEIINEVLNSINVYMKANGRTPLVANITENTLNEAYNKDLVDSQLDELTFILGNVTKTSKRRIELFRDRLISIEAGRSDRLEKGFLNYLQRVYEINDIQELKELIREEGIESIIINYSRNKVGDYYKRFAPAGYQELLEQLQDENSGVSVADVVDKIQRYNTEVEGFFMSIGKDSKEGTTNLSPAQLTALKAINIRYSDIPVIPFLKVSTKFEWAELEDDASLMNPDFVNNDDGTFARPKLTKYRNQNYQKRFNIVNGVATTNVKDWNMIQEMKDLNRSMNTLYGEPRNINLIPSRRKTLTETLVGSSITNYKERVMDIFKNREDEMDYGQQLDGYDARELGLNVIPKYYRTPLENDTDVSHDLLESFAAAIHEAHLYQNRTQTIGDVLLIQQDMISKQWEGGKVGTGTNAYRQFKNFMDMYFYGVKSSKKLAANIMGKEVDVSRAIKFFDRFVRKANIGFSPFIAFSSAFLSNINLQIERAVGEHVQSGSVKWASSEFLKLGKDYITNYGNVNREDKLYLLSEYFGLSKERVKIASQNKLIKAITDTPFSMMSVAAMPHSSITMLSILDDFRLIKNEATGQEEFYTFNEFKKLSKNSQLNKQALKTAWDGLKGNSLYNMLDTTGGTLQFKPGVNISDAEKQSALLRASTKIVSVNGNIDALISETDKAAATRHYAANVFMAHRGWLTLGLQRRFKSQHFNFNTGELERGHYRSLAALVSDVTKLVKKNGLSNFAQAWKEAKISLTDTDMKNAKRAALEAAIFIVMLALGSLVMAWDDDDENKDNYWAHFFSLIYARTVAEMGSTQLPYGAFEMVDTVKTPFVAVTALSQLLDGMSFDKVNSGAYKGRTKLEKMIAKQTWIRHFVDMSSAENIKSKLDAYRYFKSSVLSTMQKPKASDVEDDEDEDFDTPFNPYDHMSAYESIYKGLRK